MTNFEFYKKEIAKIAADGSGVAITKGEPVACDGIKCANCDFECECSCGADLIKWLYAEHVEKPKISKRTKMFFEAIETGWVAMDMDGSITIYENRPVKKENYWSLCQAGGDSRILNTPIYRFLSLDFIKWEDEEPWSVEDILKVEVEG